MIASLVKQFGRIANRIIRYADRYRLQQLAWNSTVDNNAVLRFHEVATGYRTAYESLLRFKTATPDDANSSLYPWPAWEHKLATEFSEHLSPAFMDHPIIKETMVFHGRLCNAGRLKYVRRTFGDASLRGLLAEDSVGAPQICSASLRTSSNRLYHLFHLAMYQQTTGRPFTAAGMIVEWGGGYGDMARLVWRLRPEAKSTTLVLIDLPAVGGLQWVYLTSILGRDQVHIVDSPDCRIHEGCVNIMNSAVALQHPEIKAKCFISTWALTESPHGLQSEIARRDFFGAENVLLAFSMDGDNRIIKPLVEVGGVILSVPFMLTDGYAPSEYGFL